MADFIAIVILVGIVAAAAYYVYRAKKSGKKCIGCPEGCACSRGGCACSRGGCGSCGGSQKNPDVKSAPDQ